MIRHLQISLASLLFLSLSAVAQERSPDAATPPAIPPSVPPGASSLGGSALKFSGFFDIRFSSFDAGANSAVKNDHAQSGFGLEDGAFYVNYDKDRVAFVMDIAFRRAKTKDTNAAATVGEASENANFMFGWDKSQLYLRYKITDALVFDMGQFDTLYGVELNDSKDRVFGKTGLVYDLTLPVTHMGAMLEYASQGFYGKVFGANPNNKGTNGTSTSGDESTEYGVALGYGNDWIHGQAGYMTRPINQLDGTRGARSLTDVTFGMVFGRLAMDFEYASVADPTKNTLTAAATDEEDAGTGFLALVQYKLMDPLTLGVRYEYIDSDPGAGSIAFADSWGGSVHYKVSSEFELRSEYVGYNYHPTGGGDGYYDARFNVAALMMF